MSRKAAKRSGDRPQVLLDTQRLAELATIVAEPGYVLGPQDEEDLIEALRELVDRRRADELAAKLPYPHEPEKLAA